MDEEVKNFFEKIIEEYQERTEKKNENKIKNLVLSQLEGSRNPASLLFKKSVRKILNVNRLREQKTPSILGYNSNLEYKCKIKSIKTKRTLDLLNPKVYRKFYTKKYQKKSNYFLSKKVFSKNSRQKQQNGPKQHQSQHQQKTSFEHLIKRNKPNENKVLSAMCSTGNFFQKRKRGVDHSAYSTQSPFFQNGSVPKFRKSKARKTMKKSFSHKLNEILQYKNQDLPLKSDKKYQKFMKRAYRKLHTKNQAGANHLNFNAIKKLKRVNYDHFRGLFQNLTVDLLVFGVSYHDILDHITLKYFKFINIW